ncbi:putative ribonuclease H-like domain-containing protein [Tanacetum coccineum]
MMSSSQTTQSSEMMKTSNHEDASTLLEAHWGLKYQLEDAHHKFSSGLMCSKTNLHGAQNVAFVSQSKSITNKVKSGFTGAYNTCTPSTSSTNIPKKEVLAAKGTHDGKKKRDSFYQHQEAGKQEKNQMGLLIMDDGIVNWGEHTEDEETNHALMAISSSSEVSLCSKTCIDSYKKLKTLCDEQMNQLGDQEAQILAYSQAVKKLEAQLVTFQKQQLSLNEKLTFQANEIYEKDEKLKKYRRIGMKAVKEKEQLQKTLDSWKDSSKNLWRLINSCKEDSVGKPLYSRFIKTNDFKGVPHPLSGDYTPTPHEEIDESLYVYGKKGPQELEPNVSANRSSEYSTCQSNDSAGSIGTSFEHSVDPESKISRVPQECIHPIKDQATPKVNRKNWNAMMESRTRGSGKDVNPVMPKVNTGSSNVNTVRTRQPVPTRTSNSFSPKRPQILLKVPRHHNIYSFDMMTPTPAKGFACLIAKATFDESKLWHRRFSWVFFLASKDETSGILQNFIRQIENQLSNRVKIIRSDNGTEFKNRDMLEFCGNKGIKQEYSNARSPQQNGVAKRMNRTLIEAARTMLADLLLPTTFWAEAVSTPQTPSSNASEEKDKDVELIVVPSTILTELQQEKKASSTNTSEDNPKILAFRRELEDIALKHLGKVSENTTTSTPSVNTGNEPVNTSSFDPDDSPMPELEIFHKSETGIFDEASYDEEGMITDFNSLPTEIEVSPTPTLRIHNIHLKSQILGDPKSDVQTRSKVQQKLGAHALFSFIQKQQRNNHKDQQHCLFACFLSHEEPKKISEAL